MEDQRRSDRSGYYTSQMRRTELNRRHPLCCGARCLVAADGWGGEGVGEGATNFESTLTVMTPERMHSPYEERRCFDQSNERTTSIWHELLVCVQPHRGNTMRQNARIHNNRRPWLPLIGRGWQVEPDGHVQRRAAAPQATGYSRANESGSQFYTFTPRRSWNKLNSISTVIQYKTLQANHEPFGN